MSVEGGCKNEVIGALPLVEDFLLGNGTSENIVLLGGAYLPCIHKHAWHGLFVYLLLLLRFLFKFDSEDYLLLEFRFKLLFKVIDLVVGHIEEFEGGVLARNLRHEVGEKVAVASCISHM